MEEKEYLRFCIQMKKNRNIYVFFLAILTLIAGNCAAQERDSLVNLGIIKDGDTLIYKIIPEVAVYPGRAFRNSWGERRYNRYVSKVKKVYPYAKLAGEMLDDYEPRYLALDNDKDRRKMMKSLEQQLLKEYKDDLKRMTISEGHILIKLIDRETRRTSYTIIKDFRGGVPAVFWQGIARIFGGNLKTEYDPNGEDWMIEEVVRMIELGYL